MYLRQVLKIEFVGILSYVIQIVVSIMCLVYIYRNRQFISKTYFQLVFSFTFLFLLCVLVNSSEFKESLKIIFALVFFGTGYVISHKQIQTEDCLKLNTRYVYFLTFFPLIVFLTEKLKGSNQEYLLLVNSNNFVYYGLVIALFFAIYKRNIRFFFFVAGIYLLLGKTIGAILALTISIFLYLLLSRKIKFSNFILISLLTGFLIYLGFTLKLSVFERIQDSYNVYNSISANSASGLAAVDFGDAAASANDPTNLSFLFRIKHWTDIIDHFNSSNILQILFGHGENAVTKEMPMSFRAHNDYLSILYEYGVLVFLLLMSCFYFILRKISGSIVSISFIAIFIYYFTDNLFTNFLASSLQYFLLGYLYCIIKSNGCSQTDLMLFGRR